MSPKTETPTIETLQAQNAELLEKIKNLQETSDDLSQQNEAVKQGNEALSKTLVHKEEIISTLQNQLGEMRQKLRAKLPENLQKQLVAFFDGSAGTMNSAEKARHIVSLLLGN